MIDENKLLRVIADGLDAELSEISLSTKSSDLPQWDSLGHLTLLMKLDKEFEDLTEKSILLSIVLIILKDFLR